jgi:hypothetical protein
MGNFECCCENKDDLLKKSIMNTIYNNNENNNNNYINENNNNIIMDDLERTLNGDDMNINENDINYNIIKNQPNNIERKIESFNISSNTNDPNNNNDLFYIKNQSYLHVSSSINNINIINSNEFESSKNSNINNNNNNIKKNNNNNNYFELGILNDFCQYLFDKINEIRTNPKNFIDVINESKKNIIKSEDKFYYKQNNVKIVLKYGQKSFDDAIEYLQNLESMNKLQFDNDLLIPLPKNQEDLKDKNYLKNNVYNKIRTGIRIKCFWRSDINIKEVCLLMMILDENNEKKEKRNSIFNKNMKKIGINSVEIENLFCCYILLSD